MSRQSEHFQSRWGDSELDDNGYLYVPGWIMRNYHKVTDKEGQVVGLTPNEFTFLCHVMCFKYDVPTSQARPSLETIADQVGRHVSNIRKWKTSLEEKGLLEVTHIEGKPSIYDFSGLVKQCRTLQRNITTPSEITRGSDIDKTTPSEIANPPLAKSLTEDIEVNVKDKKQKDRVTIKPELEIVKQPDTATAAAIKEYEANIGMVTPMLADDIKDYAKSVPDGWIPEAIKEAVLHNGRSWAYVKKILDRWQREGKGKSLAKQANGYHTMSPAQPEPQDHRKATPEELDAILAQYKKDTA